MKDSFDICGYQNTFFSITIDFTNQSQKFGLWKTQQSHKKGCILLLIPRSFSLLNICRIHFQISNNKNANIIYYHSAHIVLKLSVRGLNISYLKATRHSTLCVDEFISVFESRIWNVITNVGSNINIINNNEQINWIFNWDVYVILVPCLLTDCTENEH